MSKSPKGPAPKRTPHVIAKPASARRHPAKPTGKGSAVVPAKPVSSKKPVIYSDKPNTPFRNSGTSGSPGPSASGFTVIPGADRPGADSDGPYTVPDYSGNQANTAAGKVGADPQAPNPNPNSPSQNVQRGIS
jgi:hypothetical protein